MARRRKNNRRRRGRSGFLYKLLSVLAICACLVAALTLFFRVDTVVVTGGVRYTEEELRAASGVEAGANLLLLNKARIAASMTNALPYIKEISSISKKLPNTLVIEVEECGTPLAMVQEGIAWLISPTQSGRGKIVEQMPAASAIAAGYGVIDGCQLLAPSVGTRPALPTENASQQSSLLSLMNALEAAGMLERVDAIHLEDPSELTMELDGRFTVRLSYNADYERKLKKLEWSLEEGVIQDNMVGTFDMRGDSRDYFQQVIG